jgi:hypothetical protein
MEPKDLTLEVLEDIRAGIGETNTRIDAMAERLDGRIDALSVDRSCRVNHHVSHESGDRSRPAQ